MKRFMYLKVYLICTLLISCSSLEKSMITGSSLGTGLGALSTKNSQMPMRKQIGQALIGTTLGGLIGYLVYKLKKKKPKKKKLKEVSKNLKGTPPFLTRPVVRSYMEPDQIIGNKYIEKHKVWILESTPTWTK